MNEEWMDDVIGDDTNDNLITTLLHLICAVFGKNMKQKHVCAHATVQY